MTGRRASAIGAIASLALAGFLAAAAGWLWPQPVADLLDRSGSELYSALLSASTSMLGFMLATLSIAAGIAGLPTATELRERDLFRSVQAAFFRPVGPMGCVALLSLAGLFAPHCRWILVAVVLFVGLCVAPLAYAMAVLKKLLDAVGKPDDPATPTAMHERPGE